MAVSSVSGQSVKTDQVYAEKNERLAQSRKEDVQKEQQRVDSKSAAEQTSNKKDNSSGVDLTV